MPNKAISPIVAPADPNVEGVGSGMEAGSNQVMIGLATNVPNPKVTDFPQIAQADIKNQYLGWGGDSVEPGQEDADIPSFNLTDYDNADFNDTPVGFVQADAAVAPGGVYETGGGFTNRTDAYTTQVGDWLAGAVPV